MFEHKGDNQFDRVTVIMQKEAINCVSIWWGGELIEKW